MRSLFAHDLRAEIRWLAGGYLLTLSAGFGQTYFIALFAGFLKTELSMSDGMFGSLYAAGTLTSAALLIWAGKFADRFPARWLGVAVLGGLAAVSLLMASVTSAWMLVIAIFGLRFFGQGMLPHVAMTAMGKWFNRKRGRAVSIAALGAPTAEALWPIAAVMAIALVGWRTTWVAIAVVLVLVSVPVLIALLTRERVPTPLPRALDASGRAVPERRDWTRAELLRSPLFYALQPGLLAMPFIATGIFFNQVAVVEIKGWELSWFAASFPVMAAANVFASLSCGWLVDRFGARRLLPWFQLPQGIAITLLILVDGAYVLVPFMALMGVLLGSASVLQGALWAELYGTRHLGAIRALAMAGMVFASALSPGMIGILLDLGVPLMTQFSVMAVYCFAVCLWMAALMPRLHRQAASG